MDQKTDILPERQDQIVYVRSVTPEELPEELREQVVGVDHLYAVHSAEGERLALVKDRDLAFQVARQNDLAPVSVH